MRVYLDGPWDALAVQEPGVMECLYALEEELPTKDELAISRRRTELADAIISALQAAYRAGRHGFE